MDEDRILQAQHPAYAAFCREEYDPDGGYYDFMEDRWEVYDDMGR